MKRVVTLLSRFEPLLVAVISVLYVVPEQVTASL